MRPISSHLTTENMVAGRPAGQHPLPLGMLAVSGKPPTSLVGGLCLWRLTQCTPSRRCMDSGKLRRTGTAYNGDVYPTTHASYIPSHHNTNSRHYNTSHLSTLTDSRHCNTESERAGGRENRGRQTQERVGSLTSSEHTYKQDLSVKKTKKHATVCCINLCLYFHFSVVLITLSALTFLRFLSRSASESPSCNRRPSGIANDASASACASACFACGSKRDAPAAGGAEQRGGC